MRRLLLATTLTTVAVAGCGGSSPSKPSAPAQTATTQNPSGPVHFPSARGQTLTTLRSHYPRGPILAPSTAVSIEPGTDRFGFALFTADQKQIENARVAIYTFDHAGRDPRGPFPVRAESLAVAPQFQSATAKADPDAAKAVYVARVPVAGQGRRVFTALARIGNRTYATTGVELTVGPRDDPRRPPDVGQRVPDIHTPTLASAGGDAKKIDTRSPPATDLLRDDLHAVLGRKPVVLTFATPLLCQSRVCGPVVDVVEQVAHAVGPKAAFIHVEIYKGNQVNNGFLPQVAAFRLPTEPWTFVIDRHGRVSTRFEGAVGPGELLAAVRRVTG